MKYQIPISKNELHRMYPKLKFMSWDSMVTGQNMLDCPKATKCTSNSDCLEHPKHLSHEIYQAVRDGKVEDYRQTKVDGIYGQDYFDKNDFMYRKYGSFNPKTHRYAYSS